MEEVNVVNFRGLGGIPAAGGRKVRDGLFFRGGPFQDLDEKTKRALDGIGFRHILDLRSVSEVERGGKLYIPEGAEYVNISGLRQVDLDMVKGANRNSWEGWMEGLYRALPFRNEAYQVLFDYVKKGETPLYFHCSAGKDRTGVFAALLLKLLDVPDEEIFKDYMVSYDNMMRLIDALPPLVNALVDRNWLEAVFDEILKRYPDLDAYYLAEYGIDEELKNRIREKCLIREG